MDVDRGLAGRLRDVVAEEAAQVPFVVVAEQAAAAEQAAQAVGALVEPQAAPAQKATQGVGVLVGQEAAAPSEQPSEAQAVGALVRQGVGDEEAGAEAGHVANLGAAAALVVVDGVRDVLEGDDGGHAGAQGRGGGAQEARGQLVGDAVGDAQPEVRHGVGHLADALADGLDELWILDDQNLRLGRHWRAGDWLEARQIQTGFVKTKARQTQTRQTGQQVGRLTDEDAAVRHP